MGDDGIRRFVVRHYRYDPARRERRHVVVAAFDNRREFNACVASVEAEIRNRPAAGEQVESNEHASGIVREPGADRRAANAPCSAARWSTASTPAPGWMRWSCRGTWPCSRGATTSDLAG